MNNLSDGNFDKKKIQMHRSYFENYYGSDFRLGQGLDEITDMISSYSMPGTWIDLGGGTSTFIWLPAFREITEVHSLDKDAESAYVQELVRSMAPSGCYRHILNRYGKSIEEMSRIHITYSQMDLFSDFTINMKYDNVSQIGLLGLCRTKSEYLKQLVKLSGFMSRESVFIGANWVFSSTYAETRGFANSYLNTSLVKEYVLSNRRKLLYSERIAITNDPCYDAIIVYAFMT